MQWLLDHFLGLAAAAGVVLSMSIQFMTAQGVDACSRIPPVWLLHFMTLALFGAFVISVGHRLASHEVNSRLPTWAVLLTAAATLYVAVNTIICIRMGGEGNPQVLEGHYVVTSHGRVLAQISESAYHLRRAYELRLFSGIWLLLCLVSALYFLFWRGSSDSQSY